MVSCYNVLTVTKIIHKLLNIMAIAILTDFGLEDAYTGIMKGVMLKINPGLQFVDISNSIPQGNIKKAAFKLFTAYKYFPDHTIFLVVVDPGVGTNRFPIIVKTKNYYFVGPDNGVFSWIHTYEKCKVYKITSVSKNTSNTFHGRDIFAPAAAMLSKGIKITDIGKELTKYISFKIPTPKISKNSIQGEIIDIDGFGNLITNIKSDELSNDIQTRINNYTIFGLKKSYLSINNLSQDNSPISIPGSAGFLEISLPNGNCSKKLGVRVGTHIYIKKANGTE